MIDDTVVIPNHWLDDLAGLPPLTDSSWRREPFPYRGWNRLIHCIITSGPILGIVPWILILLLMDHIFGTVNLIGLIFTGMTVWISIFSLMFFSKDEYG